MSDFEDLLKQKDELIELYKGQCSQFREDLKMSNKTGIDNSSKSNFRMFWVAIVSMIVVIAVTAILSYTNGQLQNTNLEIQKTNAEIQKSFIDFMNQYEYAAEVTTQTYTVTQDNEKGNNNNYIGNNNNNTNSTIK